MKLDPRSNKDFLAGLIFLLIGAAAMLVARGYPFGSAMRMGPGYFPTVLGGILCLFGLYVMLRGIRSGEPVKGEWGWRPLALVTLSIVLFGFVLTRLGLVPALLAMFFAAALGGREFRFREVLGLSLLMSAFAVAVFVYGLKLPLRLLGGW
jgi:uncharacterized membrane protein